MSAWDDIISKRLSPGTGPIGVKGIKPVHSKVRVCTKTLTEMGRPRYICPRSAGKQAVRSLETLPVKPEDVPEKTQQIAAFSPEQQYTPKQQREEPEKIKDALLRRPTSIHLDTPKEAGPDQKHDHLHAEVPDEAGPDTDKDTIHAESPKEAKGPSPSLKDLFRKVVEAASEEEGDEVKKSGPVGGSKSSGQARAKARAGRGGKGSRARREKRSYATATAPQSTTSPKVRVAAKSSKKTGVSSKSKHQASRGDRSRSAQLATRKLSSARDAASTTTQKKDYSQQDNVAAMYNLPEDYTESDLNPTQYEGGVRELVGGGFVVPGGHKTYESKEAAQEATSPEGTSGVGDITPPEVEKDKPGTLPNKKSVAKFKPVSLNLPKSVPVQHKGRTVKVDTTSPEFIAAEKTYSAKKTPDTAGKEDAKRVKSFLTDYVKKTSASKGDSYFKDFQKRKHDVVTKQATDEKKGKFAGKLPKPGSSADDLKPVDTNAYPGISESKSGGFKAHGIDKMFGSADDAYEALHGEKPRSKGSSVKLNREYGDVEESDLSDSFEGGVRKLKSGGYAIPKGKQVYASLAEAQLALPKGGSDLADKTINQDNWQAFKRANEGGKGGVKFPKTFKARNSAGQIVEVDTSSKFFKNRVAQFWTPDRTRWQRKNYEPSETLGKYLKVAADGKLGEERAKNYKGPSIRGDYGSGKRGRGVGRTKSQLDPGGDINAPRTAAEKAEEKKFREFRKKQEAMRHSRRSIEAWEGGQKARNKRIAEEGYDKDRWHGTIGEVSTGELLSTIGNAALWVLPGGAYVKGAQAAARGGKALGAGAKALAGTAAIKSPQVLGRAIDAAVKTGDAIVKTAIAGKHVAQTVAHKGKTYALVGMIAHSSLGGPMRAVYSVTPTALKAPISMSVKAAPSAAKATGITAPAATQAAAKVAGKTAKTAKAADKAAKTAKASKSTAAAKAADKAAKGSKIKAAAEATPQAAQAATQAAQAADEAGDEAIDVAKDIQQDRAIQQQQQQQQQQQASASNTGNLTGNPKRGAKRKKAKKGRRRRKRPPRMWDTSSAPAKKKEVTEDRSAGSGQKTARDHEEQREKIAAAIASAKVQHQQVTADDPHYSRIGSRRNYEDLLERVVSADAAKKAKMTKSQSFVKPFARRVLNRSMSLKDALDKVPWHMQDELLQVLRDQKRKKRRS